MSQKKTYKSGLWSLRNGYKLEVGKNDKSKTIIFRHDDEIKDVPIVYEKMIEKAGHKLDDFCLCSGELLGKNLIPEIKKCIQTAKDKKAAKQAEYKSKLESDIDTGIAFRVAEIPSAYDDTLCWARRLKEDEKDGYADWAKEALLVGYAGDNNIKVENGAIRDIIGNRKDDGCFQGCSNQGFIITEDEWNRIIERSEQIKAEKEAKAKANAEADKADLKHKIETGYCFNCESWCYGDCGNYSKDPNIRLMRDLKLAAKEMDYGIRD